MLLSEAIALGRVLVRPMAGTQDNGVDAGCALGMAARAVGKRRLKFRDYSFGFSPRFQRFDSSDFPILNRLAAVPCKCEAEMVAIVGNIVMHIFDAHVFNNCDWTLDQLIDWVRSVEVLEAANPATEILAIESGSLSAMEPVGVKCP